MLPNLKQFLEQEQMQHVCMGAGVGMFPWPHPIHMPLSKSQGHRQTPSPETQLTLCKLFLR